MLYNLKKNIQCTNTHNYTDQYKRTKHAKINKHLHTKHKITCTCACTCTHTAEKDMGGGGGGVTNNLIMYYLFHSITPSLLHSHACVILQLLAALPFSQSLSIPTYANDHRSASEDSSSKIRQKLDTASTHSFMKKKLQKYAHSDASLCAHLHTLTRPQMHTWCVS